MPWVRNLIISVRLAAHAELVLLFKAKKRSSIEPVDVEARIELLHQVWEDRVRQDPANTFSSELSLRYMAQVAYCEDVSTAEEGKAARLACSDFLDTYSHT